MKDGYALSVFDNVDASDLAAEHALSMPIFASVRTAKEHYPNLTAAAEDAALRMFVGTLKSKWRLKIAKCKRPECARYFLLIKQQVYKNGTFCSDCVATRRQQSAGAVTTEQREEAERELYDLAAERFSRIIASKSGWHADLKLRDRIIEYLNTQIRKVDRLRRVYVARDRDGITKKWLGWQKNRDGIDAAIRRMKGLNAL